MSFGHEEDEVEEVLKLGRTDFILSKGDRVDSAADDETVYCSGCLFSSARLLPEDGPAILTMLSNQGKERRNADPRQQVTTSTLNSDKRSCPLICSDNRTCSEPRLDCKHNHPT